MGWGNGQVDYGPAPIYGGGVVYERDDKLINALRKELDSFITAFENMFISNRAWVLVSYTLANSENRGKRSKDELNDLHKKAKKLLLEQVKKNSFKQFYENVPPPIMLEP